MWTYGDGDPTIPPEVQAAHDAAVARHRFTYRDPRTDGIVTTRLRLEEQGHCCGVGCRHCPYPASEQRKHHRPVIRPDSEPAAAR